MSLTAWVAVGALVLLCGLAMARMMWMADGRPPLRRPRPQELEGEARKASTEADDQREP